MKFTRKDLIRSIAVISLLVVGIFAYKQYAPTVPTRDQTMTAPQSVIPQIDPESIGKIVKDKDGKEFLSNQLIVEFTADATDESAVATITKNDAVIVARFTKAPVYLLQVKDNGDGAGAKRAVAQFQKEPEVKSAELNYLTVNTPPEPSTFIEQ